MNKLSAHQTKIKKAKEDLIRGLPVKPGIVSPEILQSWSRSNNLGLKPDIEKLSDALTKDQVETLLAENHLLISGARNILSDFFHLIIDADPNSVMMLLDREAHLLEIFGKDTFWKDLSKKTNIKIGTCFLEEYSGTTPASLALRFDRPFELSGNEFYLTIYQDLRDFSVPIHDERGQIVGTIELSVYRETKLNYTHTYALVVAIAGIIEKQLQLLKAISEKIFFSSSLVASMASLEEGFIILGLDDRIVHINPYVEKMLNVQNQNVQNQNIKELFKNKLILDAVAGKLQLVDHEVVLDESLKRQRYLVSTSPVTNSSGSRIGLTLIFKEFRSIQNLIQRVVGLQAHHTFDDIQGDSPEIKNVIRISKAIAKSSSNILIVGESGTGKELVAQSIHNLGIGSSGPFMAINCAAFPSEMIESEIFGYEPGTFTGGLRQGKPGKLELANGGTLLLDEINGMSLDMQVKLLRVLEEKKFQRLGGHRYISLNARIISATNEDLRDRAALGYFRGDLYYRLGVIEIQIPPLRHRRQDIPIYVFSFIQGMNRKLGRSIRGCSQEAMDYLMSYSWPGNVRELKNWIERAANLTENNILTINDFPLPKNNTTTYNPDKLNVPATVTPDLSESIESIKKNQIIQALDKCGGDAELASRDLGIGRATLYRRIKKYGIKIFKQAH